MLNLHGTSLAERLHPHISRLALGWTLLLGLGRAGQAEPALAAPELSLPLLAALLLFGTSLLLSRRPLLARACSLASAAMALLMLLRWDGGQGASDLFDTGMGEGASMLGRYAIGSWLLLGSLGGWLMAGAGATALVLGLAATAAACLAAAAAGMFALASLLIFGTLTDARLLLSPALLAGMLASSLALAMGAWAQVARRSRRLPDEAYRWQFVRHLAVLLSTVSLAGLGATALCARYAIGLLSQDLRERAELRAAALELYVSGQATLALTLQAAADAAGQLEPAPAASYESWPLLRRPAYRASLLADQSVVVEFAQGAAAGRRVRLHPLQMPVWSRPPQGLLAGTPLLCRPDPAGGLGCMRLRDSPVPVGAEFSERLSLLAPQPGAGGLLRIGGSFEGRALAARVAAGDQGSVLLLPLGSVNLLGLLGWPMLQGLGLLALLALAMASWSYWRQLPRQRELHRRAELGDATRQALPLALLRVDEAQQIVEANPAAQALLGAGRDLVGSPIARVLPGWPGARPGRDAVQTSRWEARTADGQGLPVELFERSCRQSGQAQQLLMLRDLRREESDGAALHRWQQLFDASGWGMAIGSPDDPPLLELANPAYARMLGYTPQELVGMPLRQCVAPALWEQVLAMRAEAATGRTVQAALRHRRRDGSELPTLINMSAVRDADGRLQRYLVSVQDITPLEQAQAEATRRARHLSAVLEALPVGVWIGDLAGQVQQANGRARRLWPSDADGRLLGDDHESLMRRAAVMRSRISGGLRRLVRPDGQVLSLRTTASPVIDADSGQAIGAIAIDEDLSLQQRSEGALREANDLLERILQSCAVGIALTDVQGRLLRHNLAWTLLMGPPPPSDLLEQLLEPGESLRQRELLARVGRGELPSYVGEHRLRRGNGAYGWTQLLVSLLPGGADEPARVLVQLTDIDERRRSSDEVMSSQLRLTAAQRLARVGDWHWDLAGDCFICSKQMLRMLGIAPPAQGRLARARLLDLIHPDDRERLATALQDAQSGPGRVDEDVRLLSSDGQALIVQVQGLMQHTPGGPTMAGTLQDVTERKRIESELRESREQLRELMSHEDKLIEDERKRIAREVHDELGQLLTALRMDLSMLRGQLSPDSPALRQATQMRETMGSMADVVRHVASNLRPAALDLGLVAAIEWLAEDFSLRWETHVELQLPREQEPSLAESVALALFRAVQESLTNIAKHARASHVAIALAETSGSLCLSVTDDGCGFDPAAVAARRRGGLGLLGMRERMHAIGATLDIRSGDAGTTVEIRYAMNNPPSHDQHP